VSHVTLAQGGHVMCLAGYLRGDKLCDEQKAVVRGTMHNTVAPNAGALKQDSYQ
jgi:hypothetical protein